MPYGNKNCKNIVIFKRLSKLIGHLNFVYFIERQTLMI